jgi:hypothetical protein
MSETPLFDGDAIGTEAPAEAQESTDAPETAESAEGDVSAE